MSDSIDAVAQALARNKELAASQLAHKNDLEEEQAQLRKDRARTDDDALIGAIDARLEAIAGELAHSEALLKETLAEIAELRRLGDTARTNEARATIATVAGEDPLIRSSEEIALDNVRDYARDLDARVELSRELSPETAAPPPPPVARPSREEADAAALREFQERRAKMQEKPGETAADKPPKKTM